MSRLGKYLLLVLIGMFLLNSCSSDDDFMEDTDDDIENPSDNLYDDGFFVLNEGQFPNEGTVTFVSDDLQTVEQTIFQEVNDGMELGNTPQSMFFDEDNVYIVTNSSNFIRVADRYTFEDKGIIAGEMSNPRYGIEVNGKAYITNGSQEELTVLDLEDLSVEKTIDIGGISEFIHLGDNGLLYIQQAAFDIGNKITVLDPNTDQVVETIETAQNLNSIALDENYLYALSPSALQQYNLQDNTLADEVELSFDSNPTKLVTDENHLYFTAGQQVYQMSATDEVAPEAPLFSYESDSSFGMFYGFTVHDDRIYIADGGDFASDSHIEIYDLQGNFIKTVEVGVGPNGFYFNE